MATFEKRVRNAGIRWKATVRVKGHKRICRTFERLTDARRWASETETSLRSGRYAGQENRQTLGDMVDRYIETILVEKPRWAKRNQGPQLQWWKERLGDVKLSALVQDPTRIQDTANTLDRAPATINVSLRQMSVNLIGGGGRFDPSLNRRRIKWANTRRS